MQIKKYTIHILAVTAFNPKLFELPFDLPPERNAIIICTGRENEYLNNYEGNKLSMSFLDVEDPRVIGSFEEVHARAIIKFISMLPEEVTDLYVCCSKGQSRSAAVAAALLRMSGRSDDPVWLNPYYNPNVLVYYILCKQAGIDITPEDVQLKKEQNEKAYLDLQQGKPTKYERWQIIE